MWFTLCLGTDAAVAGVSFCQQMSHKRGGDRRQAVTLGTVDRAIEGRAKSDTVGSFTLHLQYIYMYVQAAT